jgi:hypothetical protein
MPTQAQRDTLEALVAELNFDSVLFALSDICLQWAERIRKHERESVPHPRVAELLSNRANALDKRAAKLAYIAHTILD